jgi:hypothetical protein
LNNGGMFQLTNQPILLFLIFIVFGILIEIFLELFMSEGILHNAFGHDSRGKKKSKKDLDKCTEKARMFFMIMIFISLFLICIQLVL